MTYFFYIERWKQMSKILAFELFYCLKWEVFHLFIKREMILVLSDLQRFYTALLSYFH